MRRGAALALTLALGACTGPPWFMGTPLDGRPSISRTRKNPSWRGLQAEAATARTLGQTVREFPPLVALDDLERLAPEHRVRLVALLERRAAEFHALGRAVAESRDLERLARLSPPRGAGLLGERARAARDAGDAWLAVGANDAAKDAYARAFALGAEDMDLRLRVLRGAPLPPSTTRAALRAAIAVLPLRAVAPLALAYLARGGRDPATLSRALAAARQEKLDLLTARLEEATRAGAPTPIDVAEDRDAGSPDAGADAASGAPEEDARPPVLEAPAPMPLPADLDAWVLAGATISARLLPIVDAHPEVLDDGPRAIAWVDLLLGEDETSPRILELAALVFGRRARFGGTERMLMELAYATPDRALGLARGAEIWEQLGRGREACAQWVRAARWRDDAEDPMWRKAIACTRRDPGAGDWREIRGYVLGRARPDRRAALAATLDAP